MMISDRIEGETNEKISNKSKLKGWKNTKRKLNDGNLHDHCEVAWLFKIRFSSLRCSPLTVVNISERRSGYV